MASLFGARTSYQGPSQIQTVGSTGLWGGGGRGGGGGGGVNLAGIANRRAGQLLEQGSLENQAMRFQLTEAQRAAARARAPKLESWDSQTGLENFSRRHQMRQLGAQTRTAEAQSRAATQGPPMRRNWMPNDPMGGGYMPDVNAMSGAQRQAFLPQGSQFTGIPTSRDLFAGTRAQTAGQSAGELDAITRLSGMQQSGFAPGGGAGNWGWYGPQSPTGRAERQAGIEDEEELRRRQAAARMFNPQYGGGQ